MNRNYQKELDTLLNEISSKRNQEQNQNPAGGPVPPTLLLHSCCAPCSSYVLEYLSEYFAITVFYYNPNIYPPEEYQHRAAEQKAFLAKIPQKYPISFLEGDYDTRQFYAITKGLEQAPEGGERCYRCYELRLRETAKLAHDNGYDYYTTTLSISPMKNAAWINEIGERIGEELGIRHLPSDFKKKNGYKRSTELSREYGMYRQNYCGCLYSIRD